MQGRLIYLINIAMPAKKFKFKVKKKGCTLLPQKIMLENKSKLGDCLQKRIK